MKLTRCKDCIAWDAIDRASDEFGRCCRHAPRPYMAVMQTNDNSGSVVVDFPMTTFDSGCCEGEAIPQIPEGT